jgi:hypothetical protein
MKQQYPEHEKLKAVQKESQAIGEFLEWLCGEKAVELAVWREGEERGDDELLRPINMNKEKILANYFKIDLVKLEFEKRKMLEELRK